MSDLSELVLDASEVLSDLYKRHTNKLYRAEVVSAYTSLVDVLYPLDAEKKILYKKLFYERVRLG